MNPFFILLDISIYVGAIDRPECLKVQYGTLTMAMLTLLSCPRHRIDVIKTTKKKKKTF